MKYMGSKRMMLQNGLGRLLRNESKDHRRIVDLFCGSSSVAWFAAQSFDKPVIGIDLQHYAVLLASAIIQRKMPLDADGACAKWLKAAKRRRKTLDAWPKAVKLDGRPANTATWSSSARDLSNDESDSGGPIWKAYGGYYYSPTQALTFDAMLATLPEQPQERAVCHAAIVIAASKCVAAPGHTAQPFKATRTAARFLREAWLRDPIAYAESALKDICPRYAQRKGRAIVCDANEFAATLGKGDLVFLDPPYSGVHYSRFYHVLETIARGGCSPVEGTGRYPPPSERPVSLYSQQTQSLDALDDLLATLAANRCTVILTFPSAKCSNGLSGKIVELTAGEHFEVFKKVVRTRFSTLGGDNEHRKARRLSNEMILLLRP